MADYKQILRATFFKALIPQIIVVAIIVFMHWILLSIWFYNNYENMEEYKLTISSLLGGFMPLFVYGIWGIRRFVIKTYDILHEQLIAAWLRDFCIVTSDQIANSNFLQDLEKKKESLGYKFGNMLREKTENFPNLVKKLIYSISQRVRLSQEVDDHIKMIKNQDSVAISSRLNELLTGALYDAADSLIPRWIVYLIPIDIGLFIALWFL